MKLIDARRDLYRRLAHQEGYRSRAAYKLKELNKSYRIIGPGFYVLDLGCSPGGWTQVALELAGNRGKVMGIDKSFVEEIPNTHIIRGDIEDESIVEEVFDYFTTKVNAVICDISPQVMGTWAIDHAKQISLNYAASKIMDHVLARRGNALFKVFDGEYSNEFRDYLKKKFVKVQLKKPKASRKTSSELYHICLGYLGA
ncbi:MAG: 23S rRNA (uridine(2552)-2'-O)-methyltransferase [Thaumarchaeota archaeon 13_1_40CM_38_12]|nr:MAG: 23S rRNA (uridine(2552)-2'-O)-methyltransferase [Thaumarchaeota archaeon 13_1_40CM_38_12]OLC35237.1 MAG: 23S rRNA (uridine(2552)-2'-O)-methyltransferase [Thaumarchaeota archaeon 13_1_40CM_4_38_7]OLD31262.1 MAG: 23S rRNA (uridine(2552)-2'-O)-methyltransferase [Thaumarchaeota archaeon 13_1_40CM_2_39_7]TLY02658.1 MAG: RlmE family RNA methyltransferase [Nitrososphaerota archaeon]